MSEWAKRLVVALAAIWLSGAMAAAQTSDAVAQKKDWSIFKQGSAAERMCWIVSQPVSSSATRGGSPVSVRRGDIFLMVTMKPGERINNQVSMIAGYPFRKGSSVKMQIGSDRFEMFTDAKVEGGAWADSDEMDNKLVSAMRRGANAVVTGVSSRGTTTKDTFSLLGFTAALNEARKLCK